VEILCEEQEKSGKMMLSAKTLIQETRDQGLVQQTSYIILHKSGYM